MNENNVNPFSKNYFKNPKETGISLIEVIEENFNYISSGKVNVEAILDDLYLSDFKKGYLKKIKTAFEEMKIKIEEDAKNSRRIEEDKMNEEVDVQFGGKDGFEIPRNFNNSENYKQLNETIVIKNLKNILNQINKIEYEIYAIDLDEDVQKDNNETLSPEKTQRRLDLKDILNDLIVEAKNFIEKNIKIPNTNHKKFKKHQIQTSNPRKIKKLGRVNSSLKKLENLIPKDYWKNFNTTEILAAVEEIYPSVKIKKAKAQPIPTNLSLNQLQEKLDSLSQIYVEKMGEYNIVFDKVKQQDNWDKLVPEMIIGTKRKIVLEKTNPELYEKFKGLKEQIKEIEINISNIKNYLKHEQVTSQISGKVNRKISPKVVPAKKFTGIDNFKMAEVQASSSAREKLHTDHKLEKARIGIGKIMGNTNWTFPSIG